MDRRTPPTPRIEPRGGREEAQQFNAAASKHGIKNEKVDNPFRKDDLAAVIATMLVIIFLDKKASDYRET